jgi:anti-anti-sigma factor
MPHVAFQEVDQWMAVHFTTDRLTDPSALSMINQKLEARLGELPDRCQVVLCFDQVDFVSSQIIGMMLGVKDIVVTRKKGTLVLCRLGRQVREVLRITHLEKQFTIKERLRDVVGDRPLQRLKARAGSDMEWLD